MHFKKIDKTDLCIKPVMLDIVRNKLGHLRNLPNRSIQYDHRKDQEEDNFVHAANIGSAVLRSNLDSYHVCYFS